MKQKEILLVEDEREILDYNRKALQKAGYRVTAAQTVEQAKSLLLSHAYDLLILDILLPDGSGLELCRSLHQTVAAPVLFLTCLGESEQVVDGLRAGGDDYIVKPYDIQELLARVQAQLRRVERIRRADTDTGSDRLVLDALTQRAFLDGEDLLLSPKEYLMLLLLARNRSRYLAAEELYTHVWGLAANRNVCTVEVHISRLRRKLQEHMQEPFVEIEFVRGRGYRLVVC